MEPVADPAPLVVIVGETASGKSALGMRLAQHFGGEIIAADARTVYKGMDIGTAKPTTEEQALVPHHLLDVTTPDRPLSAARFQALALSTINDISSRRKLPIMIGGSGLYIDSVLFNYGFGGSVDKTERQRLQGLSIEELQSELRTRHIPLPKNQHNPRHLQRALEIGGIYTGDRTLRENTLVIGLRLGRELLRSRVEARLPRMIEQGLEQEVESLTNRYGWEIEPLKTIGYREFHPYFEKQISLDEVSNRIVKNTLNYAKRQRTWFKRNKSIHWLDNSLEPDKFIDIITTFLNK